MPDSRELSGLKVHGVRVAGLRLAGLRQNGVALHVSAITSGSLSAVAEDGSVTLTGTQLAGTTVMAELEDGTAATYRIDSVATAAAPGFNLYSLAYQDGASWIPACGIDPAGYYAPTGTPIPAVALSDTWDLSTGANRADPSRFTFGCVHATIGKCTVWGYKRWATQQECNGTGSCKTQDLSIVHEACTRLARADYCGDGSSHTVSGTGMDVYDSFNLRTRTGVPGWSLEADWRSDGAHCVRHTRYTKADPTQNPERASDADYLSAVCPSRLAVNDPSCADPSVSHFFTQYGFADSPVDRSFLREETLLH